MYCMEFFKKIGRFYQRNGIKGFYGFLIKKILSNLSTNRWFLKVFVRYLSLDYNNSPEEAIELSKIEIDLNSEFFQNVKNEFWCVLGSGFVSLDIWRENYDTTLLDKKFNHKRYTGEDIKDVWDLARVQYFLPRLLYCDAKGDRTGIDHVASELNVFCARNNFRYLPLSKCTMEVAIRAVNISVVYSYINKKYDITLDFVEKFLKESFIFILLNLEFHVDHRSNHYLSNLMGLVVLSGILDGNDIFTRLVDKITHVSWDEIARQFNTDGGNFESSSAYHLLSLEMSCLIYEYSKENNGSHYPAWSSIIFPQRLTDKNLLKEKVPLRIMSALDYAFELRKPNGKIWKYGDNDSGYIFAWNHKIYRNKDKLYIDDRFKESIYLYLKYFKDKYYRNCSIKHNIVKQYKTGVIDFTKLKTVKIISYSCNRINFLDGRVFPDTGTYIYNSNDVYLGINFTPDGQNGLGGHSHMDTGSYELSIADQDLILDPGSVTYTGNIKVRNLYRSPESHGLPFEFSEFFETIQLFSSRNTSITNFRLVDESKIEVSITSDNFIFVRSWEYKENALFICDKSNRKCTYNSLPIDEQISYGIY